MTSYGWFFHFKRREIMGDFGALFTAAGTLSAGVFAFIKWYLPYRNEHQQIKKTVSGLESIDRMYQSMIAMLGEGVDRVILLAGHNGGGIPVASKPFYISAIRWVTRRDNESTIEQYQKIAVDAHLQDLVLKMREAPYLSIHTEAMPPCKLRSYYEAEGVSNAILIFLAIRDKKFFFISLANYESPAPSDRQITRLMTRALRITQEITGEKNETR